MSRMVWLVILAGLLISGCGKNYEEQIVGLEKKTETMESRLSYLESQIDDMTQKQNALKDYYGKLETEKKETTVTASVDSLNNEGIQTALKNAGLYSGSIDGKIGPNSEKAIKAFQKENGLTPDGIPGAKTKSLLVKYLNKATE